MGNHQNTHGQFVQQSQRTDVAKRRKGHTRVQFACLASDLQVYTRIAPQQVFGQSQQLIKTDKLLNVYALQPNVNKNKIKHTTTNWGAPRCQGERGATVAPGAALALPQLDSFAGPMSPTLPAARCSS